MAPTPKIPPSPLTDQAAPVADAPPAPTSASAPSPKTPTDLQRELFQHGTMDGLQRTEDLARLKAAHGDQEVDNAIADFIAKGIFDRGQVLTEAGARLANRYGATASDDVEL